MSQYTWLWANSFTIADFPTDHFKDYLLFMYLESAKEKQKLLCISGMKFNQNAQQKLFLLSEFSSQLGTVCLFPFSKYFC